MTTPFKPFNFCFIWTSHVGATHMKSSKLSKLKVTLNIAT